jgi:hypothetical protein
MIRKEKTIDENKARHRHYDSSVVRIAAGFTSLAGDSMNRRMATDTPAEAANAIPVGASSILWATLLTNHLNQLRMGSFLVAAMRKT